MIFLTPDELSQFSTVPVSDVTLKQANIFVQSNIGDISKQQTVNEKFALNTRRKNKLSNVHDNIPLISIDSLIAVTRTPFGMAQESIDVSLIEVDTYGYVKFYGGCGIQQAIFGATPSALLVTYTWGYDVAPDDLKLATAIIAQNIAKKGTFGATGISDMDVKLAFMSDSIITSDVQAILDKYNGV